MDATESILSMYMYVPHGAVYTASYAPFYANMHVWRRARLLPTHCVLDSNIGTFHKFQSLFSNEVCLPSPTVPGTMSFSFSSWNTGKTL